MLVAADPDKQSKLDMLYDEIENMVNETLHQNELIWSQGLKYAQKLNGNCQT